MSTKHYCLVQDIIASAHLVAERFGITVSVSQLNRVRAAHGLSRRTTPREKKAENRYHHCLGIS